MPITFGTDFGGSISKAAGATFASPSITASAGQLICVAVVCDNSSGTAPILSSISKPAGETNNWVITGVTPSSASAGAAVVVSLAYIMATTAWSGTRTITLSGSVTAKASVAFSLDGVEVPKKASSNAANSTSASTITTTIPAGADPAPSAGDLIVAVGGIEDNVAYTGYTATPAADTALDFTSTQTAGGNAATNVGISMAAYLSAGNATQATQFTGGVSTDGGSYSIAFSPAAASGPSAATETASAVDSASVTRSSSASDTASAVDSASANTGSAPTYSVLQGAGAVHGTTTTSKTTAGLPSNTTPGSELVWAIAFDKTSGAITTPSGWTKYAEAINASVSTVIFVKDSAGEVAGTTFTCTHATASDAKSWIGEVNSTAGGAWTVVGSGVTDSGAGQANVTSVAVTSSALSGAHGIAVAIAGKDTQQANENANWTAGWTEDYDPTGDTLPGLWVAHNTVTGSGSTPSATATMTGTGVIADQMNAGMVVLSQAVGSAPAAATMALVDPEKRVSSKTSNATSVRIKVGTDVGVTAGVQYSSPVTPDSDGYAIHDLSGLTLAAGSTYYYRIEMTDAASNVTLDSFGTVSRLKTAPTGQTSFSLAFGSCENVASPTVYDTIATLDPDLFLQIGDFWYDDGASQTLASYLSHMGSQAAEAKHQSVFARIPSIWTPSDHDAGMQDSGNGSTQPTGMANYNLAYRQIIPSPKPTNGVYRTFAWGRVRFIILDTRTFASNPGVTDNTSKVKLGATQEAWLETTLTNMTEPVGIIVSPDYWPGVADATDDSWLGYNTERQRLATMFTNSGRNLVMLTGDQHAVAANDGSLNSPGNMVVFGAAPLHQNASQKGSWTHGPYPASGTATVDQYGYISITDSGSSIALAFEGRDSANTVRVSYTKTFTLSSTATGSDTATATDAASVARGSTATDIATGVDAASLASALAAADVATSANTASVTRTSTASDTAGAADTATQVSTSMADTATAADIATVARASSASDTATAADNATVATGQNVNASDVASSVDTASPPAVGSAATDTAGSADTATVARSSAASDSAAAVDAGATQQGAVVNASDTASSVGTATIARSSSTADTAVASDSASPTVTPTVSDAASTADSASNTAATQNVTDAAAGVDSASTTSGAATGSDTASATDLASLARSSATADTAAAADNASVFVSVANIAASDSAVGADSASAARSSSAGDAAAGADSAGVAVALVASDLVTSVDGATVPSAAVTGSEAAGATDVAALQANGQVTATETATATEGAGVARSSTTSDAGAAVDVAAPSTSPVVADQASATGVAAVTVLVPVSDIAVSADNAVVTTTVAASDSASAVDSTTDRGIVAAQPATSTDVAAVSRSSVASDTASGVEAASASASPSVTDAAVAVDAAQSSRQLTVGDTAAVADAVILSANPTATDTATAGSSVVTSATALGSDAAGAADFATLQANGQVSAGEVVDAADGASVARSTSVVDTASTVDTASVTRSNTVTDQAGTADSAAVTSAAVTGVDGAVATSGAAVATTTFINASDTAHGDDSAQLAAGVQVADSALVTEYTSISALIAGTEDVSASDLADLAATAAAADLAEALDIALLQTRPDTSPPSRTWVVDGESRVFRIPYESRTLVAKSDWRVRTPRS